MAELGRIITSPEPGFRRIGAATEGIRYTGVWDTINQARVSADASAEINFRFIGSKIQITSWVDPNRGDVRITIDGTAYTFSEYSATGTAGVLVFEKLDLPYSCHTVKLKKLSGTYFEVTNFYIDDIGKITHLNLNEVFNTKDMQVGDVIACRYTASSNGVGVFSELGTCTANEIPVGGSASPDGSFYFIHVGYDHLGRMKLIADRNIQHTISWNTLNSAGIASGNGIELSNPSTLPTDQNKKFTLRLLTGGVTASDKNNEWDKILLESSIDKSLWNLDQPSWVSTTLSGTQANRVLRGRDGYFTSLTTGTANTSTGFRPVLLVKFLNEPPVFNLTVDKEFIHREDVIVSGDVSDEDLDEIRFRFILNNEVVEDWSEFELSPVNINYTIDSSLFEFGDNLLQVEIEDSFGNLVRWNKTIKFTNINPDAVLEVDKLSTFETDVNIVGQIIDSDNDGVSYRLKVNDQVLVDWTAFYTSPHSINIPIQHYYLHIGVNTLVVEYKDEYSDVLSWVGQVILKDIDSFYVDDECHNFSDSIKVGNGSIAYLKVANANANYGYIRTADLILNIINGNFSSGVINVAPILTNWSSDSVTIESLPTIDVDNAIEVEINNATGTHEIIASQLLNKMIGRNVFGIAIYSDSFSLELDILGNTVEVDYQPTELILPENVYGNRVRIEWKPIIIRKIAAFEKIRIVRSTTPLFTTYEVIYETTDIHELVCEDRTVSEGTYYYRAEVFNMNNPINGTIDYSETTESEFIQEDEFNGTDFVSSHVQIHSVPALQNRLLDFNTPDGYIYDSSKVEVVSGKLQLKDLSI